MENDLGFERTDDLLKIATVLAVGNRISHEGFCPTEAA